MIHYLLSSEAEADLDQIKDYLVKEGGLPVARYVLREIKEAMRFLNRTPGAGHSREDLTPDPVKFWPVFSYLIVYDPAKRPIEIARVLHGRREVAAILAEASD